jgi:hypothetical protein
MTSSTRFLAGFAVAALAGLARAEDDDKNARIPVTLTEVRAFPETYTRVPFDVALLYHGPREIYNPFYTVFEPSAFLNFAAWPADARVYTRDGFADDYPLFYVDRKNGELQRAVVAMRPFTWFDARCIVRSTAQGRAWIEVLAVTKVGPVMDPGDLRHLVRANVLSANGEFERALLEFELAQLVGAPKSFVARCRGEEGRVALAANQPERAAMALQQAFQWFPEDKQIAAALDQATTQVATRRQRDVASVPAFQPPPIRRVPAPVVPRPEMPPPTVEPQAPTTEPDATEPAPVEGVGEEAAPDEDIVPPVEGGAEEAVEEPTEETIEEEAAPAGEESGEPGVEESVESEGEEPTETGVEETTEPAAEEGATEEITDEEIVEEEWPADEELPAEEESEGEEPVETDEPEVIEESEEPVVPEVTDETDEPEATPPSPDEEPVDELAEKPAAKPDGDKPAQPPPPAPSGKPATPPDGRRGGS